MYLPQQVHAGGLYHEVILATNLVNDLYEAEMHVSAKQSVAEGVTTVALRPAISSQGLPVWTPGAHIDVALPGGLLRQYSLCGDPTDRSELRIGVLREPEGRGGSRYIHDDLKVGQSLIVKGLRNNFPLIHSERYIFIAGGIGITPILPMIDAVDRAGADWQLLYGGRKRSSMAFLDTLAKYGDKVIVAPQDEVGLLDLKPLLALPTPGTAVYCCGPEALLGAVQERCSHWPDGSLHIERFKPRAALTGLANTEFEVELRKTGVTLVVPAHKSIIQTLEEAGLQPLYSCLEGMCGTCETRVLAGTPDHRDSVLTEAEQSERMMICVSRSRTKRLVLDI